MSLKELGGRITSNPEVKKAAVHAFHAQLVWKSRQQEARNILNKMHARMEFIRNEEKLDVDELRKEMEARFAADKQ